MPKRPPELTTKEIAANARFPVEAKLQSAMMRALKDLGFDLRYHAFQTHRLDKPGFLDVTAIHTRAGLLWTAELKGPTTPVQPEQGDWIEGWRAVRRIHSAGILRPVDYDDALEELRRLIGEKRQ